MRKILALIASFLLVLAACGSDGGDSDPEVPESGSERSEGSSGFDYAFEIVHTPFGPIECVAAAAYYSGGASCNWEKFNQEREADDDDLG